MTEKVILKDGSILSVGDDKAKLHTCATLEQRSLEVIGSEIESIPSVGDDKAKVQASGPLKQRSLEVIGSEI